MQERRRHVRVRLDEPARIVSLSCSVAACKVRDLSVGGACLDFDTNAVIANQFDLIPDHGEAQTCRVMWRLSDRVGVAFL
jgi:PilZ domain